MVSGTSKVVVLLGTAVLVVLLAVLDIVSYLPHMKLHDLPSVCTIRAWGASPNAKVPVYVLHSRYALRAYQCTCPLGPPAIIWFPTY
jgi:hypothetical protein